MQQIHPESTQSGMSIYVKSKKLTRRKLKNSINIIYKSRRTSCRTFTRTGI